MQVVDDVGHAVAVAVGEAGGVEPPVAGGAALPLVVEHERLDAERLRRVRLRPHGRVTQLGAVAEGMERVLVDAVDNGGAAVSVEVGGERRRGRGDSAVVHPGVGAAEVEDTAGGDGPLPRRSRVGGIADAVVVAVGCVHRAEVDEVTGGVDADGRAPQPRQRRGPRGAVHQSAAALADAEPAAA